MTKDEHNAKPIAVLFIEHLVEARHRSGVPITIQFLAACFSDAERMLLNLAYTAKGQSLESRAALESRVVQVD